MQRRVGAFLAAVALLAAGTPASGRQAPPPPVQMPTTEQPQFTFGTTVVSSTGLRGQIYFLATGTDRLPKLEKMKPKGTIYTTTLNVPPRSFLEGFPGVTTRFEWFAIDYTGKFWIEKPGPYRFALESDDGAKLYIDGKVVIDNDGIHAPATRTGVVEMAGGVHAIRVSYFQGPRDSVALVLAVAAPGENQWRIFNTDKFLPPPDAGDWKPTSGEPPKPGKF
jgi:hypothetical protein